MHVNIGDLAKPFNTLVKKCSDAVGGLFRPRQIVKIAEATAVANMILAESEIQVAEVRHRALQRLVTEEVKQQQNMESIIEQSYPMLTNESKPEQLDDDWLTSFFNKCRFVSNAEMQ